LLVSSILAILLSLPLFPSTFLCTDTPPTETYTLSLHDALPISLGVPLSTVRLAPTRTDKMPNTSATAASSGSDLNGGAVKNACEDRKSTRLNSSHVSISYAVFCLKKKKKNRRGQKQYEPSTISI